MKVVTKKNGMRGRGGKGKREWGIIETAKNDLQVERPTKAKFLVIGR